ncbi:MAG: acetoacetate--CoA ligase [Bacteroidetes bacterium]|nr:MAG: acetoacetate--CoA ligase [Bacteroidota bacterium]
MTPLWTPSDVFAQRSLMKEYMNLLSEHYDLHFQTYDELWEWSTRDIEGFWESIWNSFGILSHDDYSLVLEKPESGMIGTRWFPGAQINYAEHVFMRYTDAQPALLYQSEGKALREMSWKELEERTASFASWLRGQGVKEGDRVAAWLPNCPEALIAFLASSSLGAIWSSCSPDFGASAVAERFQQIEPAILILADGYTYNGKPFSRSQDAETLLRAMPEVKKVVFLPYLDPLAALPQDSRYVYWQDTQAFTSEILPFTPLPFDHPIFILYSSGTTGKPKAITHSTGGILLEHLKALALHHDLRQGDVFFWYSTTGWMMWNYANSALLTGATLAIYEGSAGYPDLNTLWDFARKAGVTHFGAGAAFYISCMKAGLSFGEDDFPRLRSVGTTGSPLPAEAFAWIYSAIKQDLWLVSLSGGTDVCSGFVGGSPLLPVYAGEIQCRMLGCKVEAWDENGQALSDEVGELVITEPMPSMPLYFWGDPGNARYHSSYFEFYPGVWRHGDWIKITPRNTLIIYGRSDATLNRDGVRIGTSEIYSAVESLPEIRDSLVVCIEKADGSFYMPLYVVLNEGVELHPELKKAIAQTLRSRCSPRHVPDEIVAIADIPYTISGKKMEMPVKKILAGQPPDTVASSDSMRNPSALQLFAELAAKMLDD